MSPNRFSRFVFHFCAIVLPHSNRNMKQRIIKWTALVLVGIVIVFLLVSKVFTDSKSAEPKGPGGNNARTLSVRGYIVKTEPLASTIRMAGTVLAGDEVDITSEVGGKVTAVRFREGSTVSRGQILVKLNDAELQAELKQATYRLDLARQKEQRQKSLLQIEGISRQEYDIALNELQTLSAEIDLLKARIDKTEIRAPFSGTVGLTSITEGSYLSPSDKIARLTDTRFLRIDFAVPERYASSVRKGDVVSFTIQGSPGEYKATVYAIEPQIEESTRTLRMRAMYRGAGGVYPGAFVEVSFPLQYTETALLVPTQSIVPDIEGAKVFVYSGGNAVSTPVQTGTRTEQYVQIVEGLREGDTIVTTGLLQIRPGVKVKVTALDQGDTSGGTQQ